MRSQEGGDIGGRRGGGRLTHLAVLHHKASDEDEKVVFHHTLWRQGVSSEGDRWAQPTVHARGRTSLTSMWLVTLGLVVSAAPGER